MSWQRRAGGLVVALAAALSHAAAFAGDIGVLTGPQHTTQHRLGSELAARLGSAVDVPLMVVPTAGPTDSLQRMRDTARRSGGLNLAVLQADVAQLYLLTAQGGNRDAAAWLAPLRVVAPLYNEELHFIVRSDSAYASVQDIRDARINVGPATGGTALSVATLYRLLFDAPPAMEKLSRLDHEQALARLLTDRSIDVVAILADQPVPLLANMKPEARRFIRLLKFDREHPTAAIVSRVYGSSALRAASYPNLLDQDVPALAVRLYLVVQGEPEGEDAQRLRRLAGAYCQELPKLRSDGHARWRDVAPGLPALVPGWHYSDTGTPELARCLGMAGNEIPDTCLPLEQALGLCRANITVAPATAGDGVPR
jgi:TRAP-type uncharacterized transport system substrate-binding protein